MTDVLADRGFGGLQGPIAREHLVNVEIKHRDRLATLASATAWVQVGCVAWMLTLL